MSIQSFTGRMTSSRRGAVLLGILAAAIAAILLAVYISQYRTSVETTTGPQQVLLASRLIAAGTPGSVIATKQLYKVGEASGDGVKPGAIADPALLSGSVTAKDIYPGQQITSSDLTQGTAVAGSSVALTGAQRAVTVTLNNPIGAQALTPGQRVDIYQQLSGSKGELIKLFRPNVLVLSGDPAQATFQVSTLDVADMLYAAQHTQLMFVQRPSSGAFPTVPTTASKASMLEYSRTHR